MLEEMDLAGGLMISVSIRPVSAAEKFP